VEQLGRKRQAKDNGQGLTAYTWGLRNGMRTQGLAAGKNREREADSGQARVDIDVEEADDDILPASRFLGDSGLFLEAKEEFLLREDILGVVPKHGEAEALVAGEKGAKVAIIEVGGMVGYGRRVKGIDRGRVEAVVIGGGVVLDRFLVVVWVEDRRDLVWVIWQSARLGGEDSGVGPGTEAMAPVCAGGHREARRDERGVRWDGCALGAGRRES